MFYDPSNPPDIMLNIVKLYTPDEVQYYGMNLSNLASNHKRAYLEWWIPMNDIKTNGGISFFETIKIRTYLTTIFSKRGYPCRFRHSMDYFSGVSVWVPEDVDINTYWSTLLWQNGTFNNNPVRDKFYVKYDINMDQLNNLEYKNNHDGKRDCMWRQFVCTKKVDQDSPFNFLTKIPFVGGVLEEGYEQLSAFIYPMFQNISFYNTINDVLIYRNWDFILNILNENGY